MSIANAKKYRITAAAGWVIANMLLSAPAYAADAPEAASENDVIVVTGVTAPVTTSTGLPLTFMETPQSVTIIDQKRIQDYSLTSLKDLLKQAVGVNVEDLETDRTTYNARGFDVTNFQVDGIGLPLIGNITYGDSDSFLYERIDIVRGANGLTTGIGNPSATVNYIRKRPLPALHVNAAAYVGSWNTWRGEADVSAPMDDNWGVRVFATHEEGNSYLDKYAHNRTAFGAVVSGMVTPDLTFTAGYTHQDHTSNSASWTGLWLYYSDGTPINYAQSANSAPPWAVWPTTDQQAFGELAYSLGDWTVKGTLTYRYFHDAPRILNPTGEPDRITGFYTGDSSEFETNNNRWMADLNISGPVHAFGQEHKLTAGVSYAYSHQLQYQGRATGTTCPVDPVNGIILGCVQLPNFNGPNRFNPPLPTFQPKQLAENQSHKLWRAFVATQINFTDSLHLVGGASFSKLENKGTSYGQVIANDESKLNPYIGALFDITPHLTVYASYTTIYMPQVENSITRQPLKPINGTNIEAGLKAQLFNGKFYATAAIFRTKQEGLAQFTGQIFDPVFGNYYYYTPVNVTAEGFEVEVAGRITPNWELSGGFTGLDLRNQDGSRGRNQIPRQTLKLSSTYTIPEFNNLSFGGQLRWQSDIDTGRTDQSAYSVIDLQAGIDLVKNIRAQIVVRNVADKLYLTSLQYGDYGIGQYAAPRSFTASISYRF